LNRLKIDSDDQYDEINNFVIDQRSLETEILVTYSALESFYLLEKIRVANREFGTEAFTHANDRLREL
jgi:hypothetical protein